MTGDRIAPDREPHAASISMAPPLLLRSGHGVVEMNILMVIFQGKLFIMGNLSPVLIAESKFVSVALTANWACYGIGHR